MPCSDCNLTTVPEALCGRLLQITIFLPLHLLPSASSFPFSILFLWNCVKLAASSSPRHRTLPSPLFLSPSNSFPNFFPLVFLSVFANYPEEERRNVWALWVFQMASISIFFCPSHYLSISSSLSLDLFLYPHFPVLLLRHWFILMYIYATKLKSQADLKWKLPTRVWLCAHFWVSVCVWVGVCMCVICTLLSFLDTSFFFIFKGGIPLHFTAHCTPVFSTSPFLSSPPQVSATDRWLIWPHRTGVSHWRKVTF